MINFIDCRQKECFRRMGGQAQGIGTNIYAFALMSMMKQGIKALSDDRILGGDPFLWKICQRIWFITGRDSAAVMGYNRNSQPYGSVDRLSFIANKQRPLNTLPTAHHIVGQVWQTNFCCCSGNAYRVGNLRAWYWQEIRTHALLQPGTSISACLRLFVISSACWFGYFFHTLHSACLTIRCFPHDRCRHWQHRLR